MSFTKMPMLPGGGIFDREPHFKSLQYCYCLSPEKSQENGIAYSMKGIKPDAGELIGEKGTKGERINK